MLPIGFIQFPFRVLSIAVLSFSFLTAFLLSTLKPKVKITTGILLICFVFIFSLPVLTKIEYFDKGEGFYTTNEATTTVKNEYMPKWVKVLPTQRPQQKIEIQNAKIVNIKIKNDFITHL